MMSKYHNGQLYKEEVTVNEESQAGKKLIAAMFTQEQVTMIEHFYL